MQACAYRFGPGLFFIPKCLTVYLEVVYIKG